MIDRDGSARDVSDRGLRAFVATVRSGSLTRAGHALGIGQPAVSHAIRRLERALGTPVLERSSQGMELTEVGSALFDAVDPAFGLVDDAVDAAIVAATAPPADPTVSLLVSTSLATWWLLPRLPEFKRRHPDVPLRLVTTDTDADVDLRSVDLWIPLGIVHDVGSSATTTTFCSEALVPVATPALAGRLGIDHTSEPETLVDAPLLHLEERYVARYDWKRWFEHHGVTLHGALSGDRSTDYSLVLQAALDDQGVALGWSHLVTDLIDDGRLVALGADVVTDQPFVIIGTTRKPPAGAVALRDWLVESMAASHGGRLS